MGTKLIYKIVIDFYGNENVASVDFLNGEYLASGDEFLRTLYTFSLLYPRVACDLSPEQLDWLMKYIAKVFPTHIEQFGRNPEYQFDDYSITGNALNLIEGRGHGATRTHTAELHFRKNGQAFLQAKWSPLDINVYGPVSIVYFLQKVLKTYSTQEGVLVGFLAVGLNQYFSTYGKPNISQVNEAASFGLDKMEELMDTLRRTLHNQ